ncbi:hypothetical protein RJ641_010560 [Dillenia turbinata]|uniref:Uncharacterized protein n=1 Tax=Dillenia turbinata TaxID=194707 RepID=A0AAN8Z6K1_9MAGN
MTANPDKRGNGLPITGFSEEEEEEAEKKLYTVRTIHYLSSMTALQKSKPSNPTAQNSSSPAPTDLLRSTAQNFQPDPTALRSRPPISIPKL